MNVHLRCGSIALIAVILGISTSAFSQRVTWLTAPSYEFDEVLSYSDGIAVAVKKGEHLLVTPEGQVTAMKGFEKIGNFKQGLASVRQSNGKYGLINRSGELITTVDFDDIQAFTRKGVVVSRNKKSGMLDYSGNTIVPVIYDFIGFYSEGFAAVGKDNKVGFINEAGAVTLPLMYDKHRELREGVIAVKKGDFWGFTDTSGKQVIPFEYEWVSLFSKGIATFKRDGAFGVIDIDNQILFSAGQDEYISLFPFDGSDLVQAVKNGKHGVLDRNGNVKIPFVYHFIYLLSDGAFLVWKDSKWGILDRAGAALTDFVYDFGYEAPANLIGFKDESGKKGYLNYRGKTIIPFDYDMSAGFSENLILLRREEKWGFVNTTGKVVIPFELDEALPFSGGVAPVLKGGKWGFIKNPEEDGR